MRGTQWQRLSRQHLLPSLPQHAVKGRLIFATPVGLILRGFYCEASTFSRAAFTVQVFAQALYVPADHLAFTVGGRLGKLGGGAERWWEYSQPGEIEIMREVLDAVKREGLPFLKPLDDPQAFAALVDRQNQKGKLPYLEDAAYSWLLGGRLDIARQRLVDVLAEAEGEGPDWVLDAGRRAEAMLNLLGEDEREAIRILNSWRDATVRSLRLEDYAVPTPELAAP